MNNPIVKLKLWWFYKLQGYIDGGSKKKTKMKFDNVTNAPLITSSPDKKIIESLSVPELHILLGKVLWNTLTFSYSELRCGWEIAAGVWEESVYNCETRKAVHGQLS